MYDLCIKCNSFVKKKDDCCCGYCLKYKRCLNPFEAITPHICCETKDTIIESDFSV